MKAPSTGFSQADRCQLSQDHPPDSQQIDSGEQIDQSFRDIYRTEIDAFRREKAHRDGAEAAKAITDEEILREVMNTVGRKGHSASRFAASSRSSC